MKINFIVYFFLFQIFPESGAANCRLYTCEIYLFKKKFLCIFFIVILLYQSSFNIFFLFLLYYFVSFCSYLNLLVSFCFVFFSSSLNLNLFLFSYYTIVGWPVWILFARIKLIHISIV